MLTFTISGNINITFPFNDCHLSFSREFPSNFLLQYRIYFIGRYHTVHMALTSFGITHMMDYLDFLW